MTPQLRQAIKLLQMSTTELEVEIAEAVETNPLLEWADEAAHAASEAPVEPSPSASNEERRTTASPPPHCPNFTTTTLQCLSSSV